MITTALMRPEDEYSKIMMNVLNKRTMSPNTTNDIVFWGLFAISVSHTTHKTVKFDVNSPLICVIGGIFASNFPIFV
jgi:hypothetical protein